MDAVPDVAEALRTVGYRLEQLEDAAASSGIGANLTFLQKWGWIGGAIAAVFSAGIGYTMMTGANVTDSELSFSVEKAIVKHNDYIDPSAIDPVTLRPVGNHPDLRKAIESNTKIIDTLTTTQMKLDKRSRYQFEYTKWEVKKSECRQLKNCTRRDLEKPPKLEELEADLLND